MQAPGTSAEDAEGKNGGNIRGKGGRKVTFSAAAGIPDFHVACTEFEPNDGDVPASAWAFQEPEPSGWLTAFSGKLRKPEKGASMLIFKYTISVNDPGVVPADPVIIIQR